MVLCVINGRDYLLVLYSCHSITFIIVPFAVQVNIKFYLNDVF